MGCVRLRSRGVRPSLRCCNSRQLGPPQARTGVTPQVVCLVRASLRSCLAIPEGFLEEGDFQAREQGRPQHCHPQEGHGRQPQARGCHAARFLTGCLLPGWLCWSLEAWPHHRREMTSWGVLKRRPRSTPACLTPSPAGKEGRSPQPDVWGPVSVCLLEGGPLGSLRIPEAALG